MPERENFPNAPIVEAIVDIRIEPAANAKWVRDAIEFPQLLASHPISENQFALFVHAEWSDAAAPSQEVLTSDITGIRFRSDYEVIQFRVDGFTFSMLPRYTSWNDLFQKAWESWMIYKEVMGQASVVRLAVRYINRMHFPLGPPLRNFITAPPHLPETLGRYPLRRFFTTLQAELNNDTNATIIQTIEPETSGKLPYILDIDVYRSGAFGIDDQRINETFASLHEFKNDIFFESVTESAKQLWR